MAPVITHREREARALHGARACADVEGLRARRHRALSLSSRVEVDGDLWWTPVFITIVVLHICCTESPVTLIDLVCFIMYKICEKNYNDTMSNVV